MLRIMIALLLLCSTSAWSKSVELKTGRWVIDTKRTVVLDEFDYVYILGQVRLRGMIVELLDGTMWEVQPLGPETTSFYALRDPSLKFDFVEDVVRKWKPGERLIFHKVANKQQSEEDREQVMVYNIDRDQLFDIAAFLPPEEPSLTILGIDEEQNNIILSDGSTWNFDKLCTCQAWRKGNPILIAKNTPWRSNHTHLLINLSICDCDSTVEHIHPNRLGVRRVK